MMLPFLQILHISDFHLATREEKRRIGRMRRLLKNSRVPAAVQDCLLHGFSGHDPFAEQKLPKFLEREVFSSPWDRLPAWIVNTGDHSTWGSPAAVERANKLQRLLADRVDVNDINLFGNHDAWPCQFPALSTKNEIAYHKEDLRNLHFPAAHPNPLLRMRLPASEGEVAISSLNSVVHERKLNTLAYGEIKEDRYTGASARAGIQLGRLNQELARVRAEGDLRLLFLATHHPVHYPDPPAFPSMILRNAQEVAKSVHEATAGRVPTFFMAGHTHKVYPSIGRFPANLDRSKLGRLYPLQPNQAQLVSGSTMQDPRTKEQSQANWPHVLTLLRIFQESRPPHSLKIVRLLAGRYMGQGKFTWIPDVENNQALEEIMTVPLASKI